MDDRTLELSVFDGGPIAFDERWTYRISDGKNGWRLTCRNNPIGERLAGKEKFVFPVDEGWVRDILERLTRMSFRMNPPMQIPVDDGSDYVFAFKSPFGYVKLSWASGGLDDNEELEEIAEEICSMASLLIEMQRHSAGVKIKLIKHTSVRLAHGKDGSECRARVWPGDALSISFSESEECAERAFVRDPDNHVLGQLEESVSQFVSELIRSGHQVKAIAGCCSEKDGEPMMLDVYIVG